MEFPERFGRQHIRRRLRPGAVIKLNRKMDDGKLHEKRFIVLAVDANTVTCVVNSEISRFIQNREELLICQVRLAASEHPFMDHDSFVDCSRTRTYTTEDVINDLLSRPEWLLGEIQAGLKCDIAAAFKRSRTLSPAQVKELCASLGL